MSNVLTLQQNGVFASGGFQSKLIESQDITAGFQDASPSSRGHAECANL